jgi:hypothetical protein
MERLISNGRLRSLTDGRLGHQFSHRCALLIFLPLKIPKKFSTVCTIFQAQKPLTAKNIGGYDALTVTK